MSHPRSAPSASAKTECCQRGRRHRCFVDEVLRSMWRHAGKDPRSRPLSEALEGVLRRQLGAEWVRFRAQFGSQRLAVEPIEPSPGVVRVPVPTHGNGLEWVLELGMAPDRVLTEANWQAVRRAIGIWELAAESDRKGGAVPRLAHAQHRVRDGAAPLIGSSLEMCRLRERIERVAATDFTVLIEGGIARMQANRIVARSPRSTD